MFGGNFAPVGWALCQGQLLPISTYDALYSLLGTTYGGDGTTTFALPDLRGRVPVHQGTSQGTTYTLGQRGGEESVTITNNQIPGHSHGAAANSGSGTTAVPTGNYWAASSQQAQYVPGTTPGLQSMSAASVSTVGGGLPHDNMLPFLAVNFIIALEGIFPPRS
jgi:microcystin-dependent protein